MRVLLGFNVVFNNLSVISRQCLVSTGSSKLTFIMLPHCGITVAATLLDTTPTHIILTLGQPILDLCTKRGATSTIFNDFGMSWPGIEPDTSHSTYCATGVREAK